MYWFGSPTVGTALVATAEIPQLKTSIGADGKERPRQGQRTDLANEGQESLLGGLSVNLPEVPKGKTTELAAEKAGFGSEKTYRDAKTVVEKAAPELVQAMDSGKVARSSLRTQRRVRHGASYAAALMGLPPPRRNPRRTRPEIVTGP